MSGARAVVTLVAAVVATGACGGGATVDIDLVFDTVSCGCEFEEVVLPEGADAVLIVLDGGQVETDFTCASGSDLDQLAANLDLAVGELLPLKADQAAFDIAVFVPPTISLVTCESPSPPQMVGFSNIVELDGDVTVPIRVECDPSPAAFCP